MRFRAATTEAPAGEAATEVLEVMEATAAMAVAAEPAAAGAARLNWSFRVRYSPAG